MPLRSRMALGDEPTDSAGNYLGSLTYQGYLTPVPQFPFCKMAMIILLPHKVVMRLNELIHAKQLEQCLEHSKCISCFYLNCLFLPQYSCQPSLHTTSPSSLPSLGTGAEAAPSPQSFSKIILSPSHGTYHGLKWSCLWM